MKYPKIPIFILAAAMSASTLAVASDDEDEEPFEEAYLYFELNDTDGDLGIHGKVDGDAWKRVKIEGEVYLSHIIPAAPVVASVGGETDNPGFETMGEDEGDKLCWEDVAMTPGGGVVIEWEHVTESHFDKWSNGATPLPGEEKIPLGVSGDLEDIVYYEFVAEIDETEYKTTAVVPPAGPSELNSWTIPAEIIELALDAEGEVKFEIIVRVETGDFLDEDDEEVESRFGNQTAVEDCFEI
jgi:hypothetical protein